MFSENHYHTLSMAGSALSAASTDTSTQNIRLLGMEVVVLAAAPFTTFSCIQHIPFSPQKQLLQIGVHIICEKYVKSRFCHLLGQAESKICKIYNDLVVRAFPQEVDVLGF